MTRERDDEMPVQVRGRDRVHGALHTLWPAAAAGVALGVGTQVLQGMLPGGWGVLANSGVMWSLAAFALGATMPTAWWAAVGGAAELVVASIIYYMAVGWFEGQVSDPRGAIIWSFAGVVAGVVFGTAGQRFAHRPSWRFRSLALVSGVLLGEGVHLTWLVGNPDLGIAGVVELAAGAILLVLGAAGDHRSGRSPQVLAITLGVCTLTLAAGRTIDLLFLNS